MDDPGFLQSCLLAGVLIPLFSFAYLASVIIKGMTNDGKTTVDRKGNTARSASFMF